jgi:hypothetical protein
VQSPATCSSQITYVMNRCMSVERPREHPTNLLSVVYGGKNRPVTEGPILLQFML